MREPVLALAIALAIACGGGPAAAPEVAAPPAAAPPAPEIAAAVALVAAHPGETPDPCDPSGWAFEALSCPDGIRAFLVAHPDWYDSAGVPRDVTFRADGTFTMKRSGGDPIEGKWELVQTTIALDGAVFEVGRSNAGAWLDGGDNGFLQPYPMLCDG